MMEEFEYTISDLVKKDYRTADVFRKYQLSYCCSGNIPLKSACEAKGIDIEEVSADLRRSTRDFGFSNNLPFDEWTADFLIDFITHVHHAYLYKTLPALSATLESFTVGHQAKYPELTTVTALFSRLSGILMQHNRHEDEIIFPYIKQINLAYRKKEPYGNLFVRTLRKPLHNIEKEHLRIQDLLSELQLLTNHFTAPGAACINYQVIYKKLEELYKNLIQHKYLEDEVLFPKAIAIEQNILQV
jgi:regulator of cell morphogenesis and NO signaling